MENFNFEDVVLNVYHLLENKSNFLDFLGVSPYHSGLVVRGLEYSFSVDGIVSHKPRDVELKFFKSIKLGKTDLSFNEFNEVLNDCKREFKGIDYSQTGKNCNHFTNYLSLKLLNKKIPSWVNRAAKIGSFFTKFNPKKEEMEKNTKKTQILNQLYQDSQKLHVQESESKNVNYLINLEGLECLNENPEKGIKQFFSKRGFKPKNYLESDADEQLIIRVPFLEVVNLNRIDVSINNKFKEMKPKTIKLFKNAKNLDFDNIDSFNPEQIIESTQDKYRFSFDLNAKKFKSISEIVIFVESNFGGETSRISEIIFVGKTIKNNGIKNLSELKTNKGMNVE